MPETPMDTPAAERAADAEWNRQTATATPAIRARGLLAAIGAFRLEMMSAGADATDFFLLCSLLEQALDEAGEGFEASTAYLAEPVQWARPHRGRMGREVVAAAPMSGPKPVAANVRRSPIPA